MVVPRLIRIVASFERAETLLVASIGICFAFAILADHFGYSVALGAFLAGSLVAESGQGHKVEHLILPVRDMFAAVFFVSVGMMLNPVLVEEHWVAMLILVATVIVGKILGVTIGAMLAGSGPRLSIEAGMSLAQIGEFSFIIAALALETHAARDFLYSLAVAVSVLTTFTTPYLIKASGPIAESFERRIPRGLAVLEALYQAAVEHIRRRAASRTQVVTIRWSLIAVDLLCDRNRRLHHRCGSISRPANIIGCRAPFRFLSSPPKLCSGHLRWSPAFSPRSRYTALPAGSLSRWPHAPFPKARSTTRFRPPGWESLVEIMQVAMMIVVTVVVLAIVQPFVQPLEGVVVLVVAIVAMVMVTWRGVSRTLGQMREAARLIGRALAVEHTQKMPGRLQEEVIPGLGVIVPVRLEPGSPASGKTIADLHLPSATGAVVVAIGRGEDGLVVPGHHEVLRDGDVLGLAGTHHAIRAAIEQLAPAQTSEAVASGAPT